jgi:hypothetical protein
VREEVDDALERILFEALSVFNLDTTERDSLEAHTSQAFD